MKKSISAVLLAAALCVGGGGLAAAAAPDPGVAPAPVEAVEAGRSGLACLKRGVSTLVSLGIVATVARDGLEVVGVGRLSFFKVLRLHVTNPALFQTGGVTVVLPDGTQVPATWCDGV